MNDTSRNATYTTKWIECLEHGFVMPKIYQCAQVLCFLLGTPALVWCLWISLSGSLSGGLKPTHVIPIYLFAVELVMCVEGLFEVIYYLFLRNNNMFLKILDILFFLSWICRPLFQCCICVEHYLAVAQPMSFLKYRLRRYRVGTSSLICGFSSIYAYFTIPSLGCEKITNYVFVSVYCLGVVVISLCCFFILRVLKQPGPGDVEGGRGGERQQGTKDPQKMRAFWIILTNLVIIVVSTFPVAVGYITILFTSFDFFCNAFPVMLSFNMFSVLVSPLQHLHRAGPLHKRVRVLSN